MRQTFALVHALLTPKFRIRGVIAAHFGNRDCDDSMLRSYGEILKVIGLMDLPEESRPPVVRQRGHHPRGASRRPGAAVRALLGAPHRRCLRAA